MGWTTKVMRFLSTAVVSKHEYWSCPYPLQFCGDTCKLKDTPQDVLERLDLQE
jgi:hypothetical protein